METFEAMQQFAESWALVFLTVIFVAAVIWAFRPGGRRSQDEAATSIFRHEDKPALTEPDGDDTRGTPGKTFKEART